MPARPFTHLHCHSHYSLLDGASSIPRLVERAVEHGMNALAITDHGNLHGSIEFYKACKAQHLNPIIGYEAYVAPRHRADRTSTGDNSYHLTLLCQNAVGFRNLVRMASVAALEGFYFKPRIDKELLAAHSEGIICLSGCISSEFNRCLLRGNGPDDEHFHEATEIARGFHQIFGDRYFIEIMNNGVQLQALALERSVEIAHRLGIPLVATSDCHYVDAADADAQDVMLCINTGRFRTDANRMRMDGRQYYLRSADEMYSHFPGLEDAVARSQEIADSVDIQLELGKRHFPVFKLPAETTAEERLRELCMEGLRERYAGDAEKCVNGQLAPLILERLERELTVIGKLGFANYFLICWDFVAVARRQGIPATARGSGVGALVCYALYLSHVCPLEYGLLFERFLDESRLEAPDIDIDFCKDRRGEVIRYVKDTYGEENVAQICTFGTMKARAAIKDVGRALGIPLARVNYVSNLVPQRLNVTVADALQESEELNKLYNDDVEIRELIDFAQKLEGLARSVGTHAAAVVIADRPLTEYVPLCRVTGNDDVITQWSMSDVEAAGLLKMDFLGLRNLTVLKAAVDIIQASRRVTIDLNRIPLDDAETFALLQRGETKGVFQLESGGIRDLLQKMKPDCFQDIIATNALYRPGPLEGGMVDQYVQVKNGRKPATYKHPVLQDILQETHGVMVYQEQVMQILNRLGKIELAAAYSCIKAISKKREKIIAANHEQFIRGATELGVKPTDAQDLWDMILKFAGYGFNKSHSTAYALIAYQTAYLKAHYPIEFMAALLTGDMDGRNFTKKDPLAEHIDDCRRMNIPIQPPDVNQSHGEFRVDGDRILLALSAIKGCGVAAAEAIAAERENRGRYASIFDFCERLPSTVVSRSTIESLIKAGACDSLGGHRAQLLGVLDRALQGGAAAQADRRRGQMSLFGGEEPEESAAAAATPLPDVPHLETHQLLAMEREVLGFYLSSHPLAEHQATLARYVTHACHRLEGVKDRESVTLGGMITAIKLANTRPREANAPTRYAMFDLEDTDGLIRCIAWPTEYVGLGNLIQPESIVVIQGTLDRRGGDEPNLIVKRIIPLAECDQVMSQGVSLRLTQPRHDEATLQSLYEIIRGYPGAKELELEIELDSGSRVRVRSGKRIALDDELLARLREFLGADRLEHLFAKTADAAVPHPKSRPAAALARAGRS